MQLQVGVKAFIQNDKGQYLVLEKNPDHNVYATYKWDIPGGRIEMGATLLENLAREIKEETGLDLDTSFSPKLIFAQDIIREVFHVVRLTYIAKAKGEIQTSAEHMSHKWIMLEELKDTEGIDEYIREVLDTGVLDKSQLSL